MADRLIKRQFPYRGPINSADMNAHIEDVTTELGRVAQRVEETDSELSRRRLDDALSRTAGANGNFQRRWERRLELADQINDIIDTTTTQKQIISFFDTEFIHYEVFDGGIPTGFPRERRCPVDTTYGQIHLPFNGFKSMFWSATGDAASDAVFTPELTVSYTEVSALAADNLEVSDARPAFDGSSFDPYLIRASYDVNTDIEEVRFEINIQVPQSIVRQANLISIEPAPELRCSVVDIRYSPTSTVANTLIPGLPTIDDNNPIYDTNPKRFAFNTIFITSLKVTLSSKHPLIENGRKVFYVGLRELGLYLVDWDQTWSNSPGAFTNNGVIVKLEIPHVDGVTPTAYLDDIVSIRTNPLMTTTAGANGTSTGVRVLVFEDDTLGSVTWDSVGDVFPHTITGDKDHIWLAIEMDRNNLTGLVPLLQGLVVEYTVKS